MSFACGLDFGTSNSTIASVDALGVPRLLGLEDGRLTIPSVLFFGFEDDAVHFGRRGIAEYVGGAEGRLMRSLKSILGTALIGDTTRIKSRMLGFSEILGIFLAEVKRRAERELGGQIDQVVVGRPVHFVDDDPIADRKAQEQLERAVRAQGYQHIAFQFEPIAAALDYERQVRSEQLALIVDLGGGTSDFSLVRVSPERAGRPDRSDDILATAGVHVGGTDFDRLLAMDKIMPKLGLGTGTRDGKRNLPTAPYYDLSTWHRINRLYNSKTMRELHSTGREAERADLVAILIAVVERRLGHALIGAVEAAKIDLSSSEQVEFAFELEGSWINADIAALDFARTISSSVDRIAATAEQTLRLAGVGNDDIDSIILTGGSTQIPVITHRLQRLFPDAQLLRTDVLGSVGLGLAIDAKSKFGGSAMPK